MSPRAKQVTHTNVLRVLAVGFLLVILLLIGGGIVTVKNSQSIRSDVAYLVDQELIATRLIDGVQREQAALSAVFHKLARDPAQVDRDRVLHDLDEADRHLAEISSIAAGTPDEALWNEMIQASAAFSSEARRLLALQAPTTLLSRDLFRRQEESMALVAKLAAATHRNTARARAQIDGHLADLVRNSGFVAATSVGLALLCAVLTVTMALGLVRTLERQATELSRVSWHLLENQETVARRFSHELHDELGQSLTAVKANLAALEARPDGTADRLGDSIQLVNEAIQNVRELSHLLHPTILDDFGLDAALRWLSDGFTDRTGISVEYDSDAPGRFPEEIETHLFRICQESLTNVARHSGATRVRISLRSSGQRVRLTVEDNGRGLPARGMPQGGVGLTGMRARARSTGGELALRSTPGRGLTVEAALPVSPTRDPDRYVEGDEASPSSPFAHEEEHTRRTRG
ncbi:MAG TPA: sensor histidine kinase [Bryobacteraceae bacterium]|nr:sensor histidine kinase [Bryobacteraceae bacterium]